MAQPAVQARLADVAIMLHGWACTLARLDKASQLKLYKSMKKRCRC